MNVILVDASKICFLREKINFQRSYAHFILLRALLFSLVPVVPPITTSELAIGSAFPRILPGICAGCFRLFASRTRNSGSDFQAPSCSTLCPLPWCEGTCAARLPGTGALSPSPGPGLWEDSHGLPYQQGLTGATTNQMSLGMVVVQWLFIWGL